MVAILYTIILFIVNAVVAIVGLALVINGGLMAWSKNVPSQTFGDVWDDFFNKTEFSNTTSITKSISDAVMNISSHYSISIFIIGLVILCICVAGILGVCCKSSLCLKIYMAVIFLVILAHIITLAVYFTTKQSPEKFFVDFMNSSMYEYKSLSSGDPTSVLMGLAMIKFNCCGVNNGTDFKLSKVFVKKDTWNHKTYKVEYPIPCCKFKADLEILSDTCPKNFNDENSNVNTGCLKPIHTYVFRYIDTAAYISIIILLCEVIIFLMAGMIYKENN
ncbi:unnamed protein product [Trichobilharzia szidati]|nr:unnamed protein product [Trichobilharzia szidati]